MYCMCSTAYTDSTFLCMIPMTSSTWACCWPIFLAAWICLICSGPGIGFPSGPKGLSPAAGAAGLLSAMMDELYLERSEGSVSQICVRKLYTLVQSYYKVCQAATSFSNVCKNIRVCRSRSSPSVEMSELYLGEGAEITQHDFPWFFVSN